MVKASSDTQIPPSFKHSLTISHRKQESVLSQKAMWPALIRHTTVTQRHLTLRLSFHAPRLCDEPAGDLDHLKLGIQIEVSCLI